MLARAVLLSRRGLRAPPRVVTGLVGRSGTASLSSVAEGPVPSKKGADVVSERVHATAVKFSRLDAAFSKPWNASADDVILGMRALIDDNIRVPYTFYIDALRLFTTRNDSLRTELLLLMSQKNVSMGRVEDPANTLRYTRSRPNYDVFHKLVSFAISSMVSRGAEDEAMRLWVRMASAGYITNRLSLLKIMHKISSSGRPVKSLALVDKVNGMMVTNTWHHSPGYYVHYLSALRQYLLWSCKSLEDVQGTLQRVEAAWGQVQPTLQNSASSSAEQQQHTPSQQQIIAVHVQCLVAAEAAYRSLRGQDAQDKAASLAEDALTATRALLQAQHSNKQQKQQEEGSKRGEQTNSNSSGGNVMSEMQLILSRSGSVAADVAPAPGAVEEEEEEDEEEDKEWAGSGLLYAPYHDGAGSDGGANASRLLSELSQRLQGFDASVHLDNSAIPVGIEEASSASAHGGSQLVTGSGQRHGRSATWQWSRAHTQVRSAVLGQLLALARRGEAEQCAALLQEAFMTLDFSPEAVTEAAVAAAADSDGCVQSEGSGVAADLLSSLLGSTSASSRASVESSARSRAARAAHSLPDPAWGRYLISSTTEALAFPDLNGDAHREHRRERTDAFVAHVSELAAEHDVALGISFLSQRIAQASVTLEPQDYTAFEGLAYELIDSADDSVGRNPHTYGALAEALCTNYTDPESVRRGLGVLYDMMSADISILPQTWAALLRGATRVIGDEELEEILRTAEDLIGAAPALSADKAVLHARLQAHTRLGHGIASLTLLSTLREGGDKGVSGMTRHAYTRVVHALYHSWPSQQAEWTLAKDPVAISEFLLRSMARDGLPATEHTVRTLLKLFTKAGQIEAAAGRARATPTLDSAQKFVRSLASGGFCGHAKVPVSTGIVRELVKGACAARNERRGLHALKQAIERYGLKADDAGPWEPVIYQLAKRGKLDAAEDALVLMTNSGCKPSHAVLDAFTHGYLASGDAPEAVEKLEEMHLQHQVRPAAATLLSLLDASLSSGDGYQAQRVVSFIQRMYSAEERESMHVHLSTTNAAMARKRAEDARQQEWKEKQSAALAEAAAEAAAEPDDDDDFDYEVEQYGRRKKAQNAKKVTAMATAAAAEEEKKRQQEQDLPTLDVVFTHEDVRPAYRLFDGIGGGPRVCAPLSHAALQLRLQEVGVDMPQY